MADLPVSESPYAIPVSLFDALVEICHPDVETLTSEFVAVVYSTTDPADPGERTAFQFLGRHGVSSDTREWQELSEGTRRRIAYGVMQLNHASLPAGPIMRSMPEIFMYRQAGDEMMICLTPLHVLVVNLDEEARLFKDGTDLHEISQDELSRYASALIWPGSPDTAQLMIKLQKASRDTLSTLISTLFPQEAGIALPRSIPQPNPQ